MTTRTRAPNALLDEMSPGPERRRYRKMLEEKRQWLFTMEYYVGVARKAGYTVTPVRDGEWLLEREGFRTNLPSDSHLYLFLVDNKIVEVRQLPKRTDMYA